MKTSARRTLFVACVCAMLLALVSVQAQVQIPQFLFKWGELGTSSGQFNAVEGIDVDLDGNIYAVDSSNSRVQVFTAEGEFLFAWGSFCDLAEVENCENEAGEGQFNAPSGLEIDRNNGLVYITGAFNHRVQVFDLDGNFVSQFGSQGTELGQFNIPLDLAIDGAGNIYVSEVTGHRIQVFDGDGNVLRVIGTQGSGEGELNFPIGIEIYENSLYVAENGNARIQQFDLEGNFIRAWGDSCDLATATNCESANGAGEFNALFDITTDSDGRVFVLDQGNSRVQFFTAEGEYLGQWGSPCNLVGDEDIPAGTGCRDPDGSGPLEFGDGQFHFPKGIVVTDDGRIYISDSDNHRIQVFQ